MDRLDGKILKEMLVSGCNNLSNKKEEVNTLNVFPVPDGDTGTNMYLTFSNGVNEVQKSGSDSLPVIAKTLSRGLLMGARGNSGVILSQIFRGFYQSVKEKEDCSAQDLSDAFMNGSRLAYKAVMKPVEGTILTVIREASEAGEQLLNENPGVSIEDYMEHLSIQARAALDRTPELLPILKEAKVVDSGGAGLLAVLDGFKAYLLGAPVEAFDAPVAQEEEKSEVASGYRAEFILSMNEQGRHLFKDDKFRSSVEKLGNKVTVIREDDIVKVRCNTMTPGDLLTLGLRYGELKKVQIQNIQDDLLPSIIEEKKAPVELKEYGMIAVAAGDGIRNIFNDYRVDYIVSGGQTMNPSTEDFVSAIKEVNAKHIFILPNNSNIVMAAKQAALVTKDKEVVVIETKTIPQGLSACIAFNPDETFENNANSMKEAIAHVKTGQVTYAVKDTLFEGNEIHEGDYMSIYEHEIVSTSKNPIEAAQYLIDAMCDEDTEIITIFKGEDAEESDAEALEAYINEKYDVDIDIEDGGQPVYRFIIGVE